VVFGVKEELVTDFKKNPPGTTPTGERSDVPFWTIQYDFTLAPEGVTAAQPKEKVEA
jgi:hydroxyquinol 1,2-dioxygenase